MEYFDLFKVNLGVMLRFHAKKHVTIPSGVSQFYRVAVGMFHSVGPCMW